MRQCRDNFMKRQIDLLNKMKEKQAMKSATGSLQEHQKQLKEDQQRQQEQERQQALKAQQQQQRERDEKFEREKKEADKLRLKQEEEALNREVEHAVAGIPLFPDVESGYNSGIEQNEKQDNMSLMANVREQISDGNDQGNSNSVTNQVGTLILDPDVLFALSN